MGLFEAIGGGLAGIGAILNPEMQRQTNRANLNIAREQMQFQERMSNSAHQREVADLRQAGLNPILSAGGSGSSSPGGASANMQAPQVDMPGVISAFGTLAQLSQNQQRIDNETRKIDAEIPKKQAETGLTKAKIKTVGKGAVRAVLEQKGADLMNSAAEAAKKLLNKPSPSKKYQNFGDWLFKQPSSGGEL